MNRAQQNELWFKIRITLAYLGLGIVSALIAVALSHPFSGGFRVAIRIFVFVLGFYIIEIKVEKTPHGEEDPERAH